MRGLLALEGQVADALREDKGGAGGPGAPPCLAGKVLPSKVAFSEISDLHVVGVECEGEPLPHTLPL